VELPEKISRNLQEGLDQYVAREGESLVAWLWCEMGLRAARQLLSAVIETDEPISEKRALELYEFALAQHG
jgi:hypothetical protein